MSSSEEQHIINLAKRELYSPEQHGWRIVKWPVQHNGRWYRVEFEQTTFQGIKKWVFVAVHRVAGGLKRPEPLLY